MNFLTRFVNWIKGFDLKKFFKGFVDGDEQTAADLQNVIEQSNEFVGNVLKWLASPVGDIITAVIPGTWDNDLRTKAIDFLTKVTANSGIVTGCAKEGSVGEQLSCVYNKIIALDDQDELDSFKHKLGVLSAKVFADGKLNFSDAILAAQFVFELITKKKK